MSPARDDVFIQGKVAERGKACSAVPLILRGRIASPRRWPACIHCRWETKPLPRSRSFPAGLLAAGSCCLVFRGCL